MAVMMESAVLSVEGVVGSHPLPPSREQSMDGLPEPAGLPVCSRAVMHGWSQRQNFAARLGVMGVPALPADNPIDEAAA